MRQTKVDPVDYARAIVHDCLAREFGVMHAVQVHKRTTGGRDPDRLLWSAHYIALSIVAIAPSVAIVVWLFTR
jgi:hypothetical protein